MKMQLPIDLNTLLSKLPTDPGVYRMLDAEGSVLYVGKARNLKKRVNSYFIKNNMGSKTRSLINQVCNIEVSITRSETEALLLESNLIKSLRPKYNVLLRDDKSYPYIQIGNGPYPRIDMVRFKKKPKKGDFYGPYPSAGAVRKTLGVIQRVFNIRNCSESEFTGRSRPCLQYQIKRCSAPCTQYISVENYQQSLTDAKRFLQGKCQLILDELGARMERAVAQLKFEEAAQLRDQIKSLRLVQEQQGVIQLRGDADIIVIDARPGFACIQYVTVRDGQILASRSFFPAVPQQSFGDDESVQPDIWQEVFTAFIAYFYIDTPERIPEYIITDRTVLDQSLLEEMLSQLRGKACKIQSNPRGIKSRWLDFAHNNLQISLADHVTSETIIQQRYEALASVLGRTISAMECFDISHTQGESTVASCVVFDENGPAKNHYRRFNITGIAKSDDYAAMEQVLTRRFKNRSAEQLPDLVIIDGGKGQVGVARRVMEQLNLSEVNILGIAKGPKRKAGMEKLILESDNRQIELPPDSPALHLLQYIRDEAHRFAITLHRKKRQKTGLYSSLETIDGVGTRRRQALLKRFGGLRELAQAPIDEIAKVRGISLSLAQKIYQHLHS